MKKRIPQSAIPVFKQRWDFYGSISNNNQEYLQNYTMFMLRDSSDAQQNKSVAA